MITFSKLGVPFYLGKRMRLTALEGTRHSYYRYRDLIVKIDSGAELGVNQSKWEIRVWRSLKKRDRKYFAPLVEWGNLNDKMYWVAQQFIRFIGDPMSEPGYDRMLDIVDRLGEQYNVGDLDEDTSGTNWGVDREGRIVIVDYGFPYGGDIPTKEKVIG